MPALLTAPLAALTLAALVVCAPAQDGATSATTAARAGARGEALAAVLDPIVEGALAAGHDPSLVVGVVFGDELVYLRAVGVADRASGRPASADTLYGIGSVTKVFTASLLGALRDGGQLRFDDPVAEHLPAGWTLPGDPRGEPAITLAQLASHASGLPPEPDNARGVLGDPWNDYPVELLRAELAQVRLVAPVGADVRYSNLGFALLGQALAQAGGASYERLLSERVLAPLGMTDTVFAPSPAQLERLATGYLPEAPDEPARPWRLGCLAPAGGLLSTVPDLARFVSLQFRAGQIGVTPLRGGTLAELQRPRRLLDQDWTSAVGLGWFIDRHPLLGSFVRHSGGVAGHRAHVAFTPQHEVGVIVLSNLGWQRGENPVAQLGLALLEAAVIALAPVEAPLRSRAEELGARLAADPGDDLARLFQPQFLQRVPVDTIAPVLAATHAERGACLGIETLVPTGRPFSARVIYRMERGAPLRCLLRVEPTAPHRIVFLRFE